MMYNAARQMDQEGGYQQQVVTRIGSAEQAFQERFKMRL
jgi:hypothetical protein